MAQFNSLVLTSAGQTLFNKVQLGATLSFTKIAVGDGSLAQDQSLQSLTSLINKTMDLTIVSSALNGSTAKIRASNISNHGLNQGTYIREIGVYAQDPDVGEILYAVANAGSLADYLPPESINPVEEIINLAISVGQATNVTAVVNQTSRYPNFRKMILDQISVQRITQKTLTFDRNVVDSTDDYDTDGMNEADGSLTCKKSGKYKISIDTLWKNGSGGSIQIFIFRNSDIINSKLAKYPTEGVSLGITISSQTSISLTQGDKIYFKVQHDDTQTLTVEEIVVCIECFELD